MKKTAAGGSATGGSTKHDASAKHAGTKKKHGRARSKAQIAAEKKFQEAGAHAAHVHAVYRHQHHLAAPKRLSPGDVACCSATALAASARLSGLPVTDADILALYLATTEDPDAGASILATLEAAQMYGIGDYRPVSFAPVTFPRTGDVLGRDLAGGPHAVTLDGHGAWSWGQWYPVSCGFLAGADQAWGITWLS